MRIEATMAPDFSKMTTDDLLQIIPPTETTEYEFKAAAIFDPSRFGEFKKQKLGKIVSSFANSGGGYLVVRSQIGAHSTGTISEGWLVGDCPS